MDPSLPEDDEERLSKKIKSHGNDDTVREITTISQPPASSTNPSICTGMHHTATQELPPEIRAFNFSKRVAWGKHHPYKNPSGDDLPFLPLTPVDAEPVFTEASPALCHHVNAISGRARACTMHLKPPPSPPIIGQEHQQPQYAARPVPTPIFMPVGTKGCLKGLTFQELTSDPALQCPIILANTYHLAIQPGTELIQEMNGLHSFQGLSNVLSATTYDDTEHSPSAAAPSPSSLPYNLLTDSGGFQMVSLVKLSQVTEEGVTFENPYQQQPPNDDNSNNNNNSNTRLLLRPEDSIRHQTNTGANIIMALDDVVSSVHDSPERFVTATHRTLRWYDRCYETHHHHNSTKNAETTRPNHQNLFPIVQGGLDTTLGGLREQCLVGFRHREVNLSYITPGYAIGGLAGGEGKDAFWKVVNQCCQALPDTKPRYLMG